MMLVVVRMRTDAARRVQVLEAGRAAQVAARQEPGCLAYHLHLDIEDPDMFVILEEWEDEPALRAHFAQPHVTEFMGRLPALLTAPLDVRVHWIENSLSV